jgi:hypothetical protein
MKKGRLQPDLALHTPNYLDLPRDFHPGASREHSIPSSGPRRAVDKQTDVSTSNLQAGNGISKTSQQAGGRTDPSSQLALGNCIIYLAGYKRQMDLKPVHNWAESSIAGHRRGPNASTQPQQSSSDVNHQQELGLRVGVFSAALSFGSGIDTKPGPRNH